MVVLEGVAVQRVGCRLKLTATQLGNYPPKH